MKFMFFAEFVLSDVGQQMTNLANLNTYNGNRGISFKVKQIDKPKINLTTQDLNQYNKKKVIYTKTEYPEMNIRLYDTVDDSVLALWVDYFTYYFGDSRIKTDRNSYSQSPISPTFTDDSGWGLRPLAENTQFFDSIRVLAFYARTYTSFKYINPKITMVDWQQKDYSSNDPEELALHFKYEAIEYEKFGQPYDPTTYGWLPSDSLDQAKVQLSNSPNSARPRIFTAELIDNRQASLMTNDAIAVANALAGYTIPGAGDTDAEEIQRYFSAPGAVSPTAAQPTTSPSVAGGAQLNYGEVSQPAEALPSPTPAQRITPFAQRERVSGIEAEQSRIRQRDYAGRQAAIDQGLIPADSDSNVQSVAAWGGITTRVRIDGEEREIPLTPEQQQRVDRARSMVSSGRTIMNLQDL